MNVSILIAAHRASARIAEALASVAQQTHTQWDISVVEYGTADGTQTLVQRFARGLSGTVNYEFLADAPAPAAARNRLLDLATGDAVAFLEPGDTWLPRHLANAVQQLNGGADVAVSNARYTETTAARAADEATMPPQLATSGTRILFAKDVIPSASCVVLRRTIANAAGRFDLRFRTGETRDFWLRCAVAGGRFALTQMTTCRLPRPEPSDQARRLQAAELASQFYEKHRDLAAVPAALRRRQLAGSLVAQGRLLRNSDPARAARCFWRAWSLQPVHVQTLGQFALTGPFAPPPPQDAER